MSVRGIALRVLSWAEHLAAMLFLAVLTLAAVLYFGKKLDRERTADVLAIVRGEKVAMTGPDRDRLAEFDRQAASRSAVERTEAEGAGLARAELERRRVELEAERSREYELLKLFSDQLAARERKLSADAAQLADGRKKLDDAQKAFQDRRNSDSLSKVLKVYANIDAEIIAADFEKKLEDTSNKAKFDEVVEILRRMPERQASEVLAAMAKPETRNSLMEALRKS